MSSAAHPLLEARHVSKAFPGVQALDDVSLAVYAGEVHVVLGQNGAGKSTLIKTLYGAYRPDQGEFLFDGSLARLTSPADARRLGIAVMFQEFSLVPYLSIAQNIFLGREFPGRLPGTIDRASHAGGGGAPAGDARHRRRCTNARTSARRRAAADGRNREGAVPARARAGHGRTDGGVVGSGDRAPLRHHPHAQSRRRRDRLHFPPPPRDLRDRRSDYRAPRRPEGGGGEARPARAWASSCR